jgi:hypothetical protein
VALIRRDPDDVAGADFQGRAAIVLDPAEAGGDDQGLAERVGVPGGSGAGLKSDQRAADTVRVRAEERVDADGLNFQRIRRYYPNGLISEASECLRRI